MQITRAKSKRFPVFFFGIIIFIVVAVAVGNKENQLCARDTCKAKIVNISLLYSAKVGYTSSGKINSVIKR